MKKALKAAFPFTVPVMLGYISVGIAFGLLAEKSGLNFLWALLMSLAIYAGSMQFIAINLIVSGLGLVEIGLMTLFLNIRHLFYGLSFIDRFKTMGRKKLYMIFSLSDETYSLLCAAEAPEGINSDQFLFSISLLNQIYWLIGTLLGSMAGNLIKFNTAGIDFAMTALFVVIFIEQWKSFKTHIPAFIGIVATVVSLVIFGPDNLIVPSMGFILVALAVFKNHIEAKDNQSSKGDVISNEF